MCKEKLILIIDDDPDCINTLSALMDSEGFRVISAYNAQEAIELLKTTSPDFILCDMMMEDMDSGVNVSKELRKHSRRVPLYLCSSIGDATGSYTDINELGFDGVFQKPVDAKSLIKTIKEKLKLQ